MTTMIESLSLFIMMVTIIILIGGFSYALYLKYLTKKLDKQIARNRNNREMYDSNGNRI